MFQTIRKEKIEDQEKRKYGKSGLKEEDIEKIHNALETYMSIEKPYLDPDLTIVNVASALKIPKHYITQVINGNIGKNFYQYVNEYRIDEVIRKISDKGYASHSIMRIAYDAGFNSKSVFNTMFKKKTSVTPSEFRKKVLP
jgi:AraC-like DNA-binding protein